MRGLGTVLFLAFAAMLSAQTALTFPPPKITPPTREILDQINERSKRLDEALDRLQRLGLRDPAMVDIEVYLKAAQWIVRHNEFYRDSAKWVLPVLDQGLLRAAQLSRGEHPWLLAVGQTIPRGYRSRIDGSIQPYAVTLPHDYAQDRRKRYPIHVVLHGRDSSLTEVSFLHRHGGGKPAPRDLAFVQIDIYGRGNNAYRWAGESDVFEAVENFLAAESFLGRISLLDQSRVVLRGFSMGGAGTWHIGLHRPDQFVVLGPGAGFTRTHGYIAKLPPKLPDHQEACLRIYDAYLYAENAANVPVVAYSGEDDPQMQAARNIEAELKSLGLSMTHLVAPKLGHSFPPEWQKKAFAEYNRHIEKGKPEYPARVRFATYTLRYPSAFWVELLGLDRHYDKAHIDAERRDNGFAIKSTNIRQLKLALWPGATREPISITIDGQKLDGVVPQQSRANDLFVYLEKSQGKWSQTLAERLQVDRLRTPQKHSGLQGPIDDAFTAPFLCVRGTGKPWHDLTEQYHRAKLEQFQREWSLYLRGDLPVKDDTDVTAEDIASRHLILFGDPSSNSLIAQVLPRLPIHWSAKSLSVAGKEFDASRHLPALIFPSPLAPERYVVLNSGHTFHAEDFQGTNALLYPRLGDYAVLQVTANKEAQPTAEVKLAGLFDDFWRFPGAR